MASIEPTKTRDNVTICIQWHELSNEAEYSVQVSTIAGTLIVSRVKNVITKMEWSLVNSDLPRGDDVLCGRIQAYIQCPNLQLDASLKKQGTLFRNKVWLELCRVPVGQVISYSVLAEKLGSGARAVANACRDNPFPVIIPCHRIVAANGLGGYMGKVDGKALEIKKKLLAVEASR